jgi:hypothetical protein
MLPLQREERWGTLWILHQFVGRNYLTYRDVMVHLLSRKLFYPLQYQPRGLKCWALLEMQERWKLKHKWLDDVDMWVVCMYLIREDDMMDAKCMNIVWCYIVYIIFLTCCDGSIWSYAAFWDSANDVVHATLECCWWFIHHSSRDKPRLMRDVARPRSLYLSSLSMNGQWFPCFNSFLIWW